MIRIAITLIGVPLSFYWMWTGDQYDGVGKGFLSLLLLIGLGLWWAQ